MAGRGDTYSYPPRGMDRVEAARYVGIGTTKFDELVSDGRMPKPRRVDGRVLWDRIALDIAFSELPEERRNFIDDVLQGPGRAA